MIQKALKIGLLTEPIYKLSFNKLNLNLSVCRDNTDKCLNYININKCHYIEVTNIKNKIKPIMYLRGKANHYLRAILFIISIKLFKIFSRAEYDEKPNKVFIKDLRKIYIVNQPNRVY